MSASGVVLAVDGGGRKTDVALVGASGALLAYARGGSGQVHYLGVDGFIGLLERLLEQAGIDLAKRPFAEVAQLHLAGIDVPEEHAALVSALERRRWANRLIIGNDTEALLRAGTDRGWGIAVVCGTGINCLGVAPDGRRATFLSFGDISGDWGGGHDIAVAALAGAVRAADRRGPRTVLAQAVPATFGLRSALEVAQAVHLEEMPIERLDELVPLVLEVFESDAVAGEIVARVVDSAVAFVRAAVDRLGLAGADPAVALGGRVLRSAPAPVIAAITRGVQAVVPRAQVAVAESEPIVGAALFGLDAIGAGAQARRRARAELDGAVARAPAGAR